MSVTASPPYGHQPTGLDGIQPKRYTKIYRTFMVTPRRPGAGT